MERRRRKPEADKHPITDTRPLMTVNHGTQLMSGIRSLVASLAILVAPLVVCAQSRSTLPRSAAISDVHYAVTFKALQGIERTVDVSMSFVASGRDPVVLSLPIWTPGDYEVSSFARNVSQFSAIANGKALTWDKVGPSTWRIVPERSGPVTVGFRYKADSLDNSQSWAREDFLLFNGTNLFPYPEGRALDFPAMVTVHTEDAWRVVTGMTQAGSRAWTAPNYHELVDHPFFIGRFDLDSVLVAGAWMRFSSYPSGSVKPAQRTKLLDQMARAVPAEVAVFGDRPWSRYDIMQIADSSSPGMSALEHENSNVGVVGSSYVNEDFVPSVYAHEIFHAWNVKRLRPLDMWPYRYDTMQPTVWLWVSEGITDYYADLALVRGGVINATGFLEKTEAKIDHVDKTAPVALSDASLQTWIHMTDGTQDIYYDKGSLAGLALDIMIRDATDNAVSLDGVMRSLYTAEYRKGRGFTPGDWWGTISRAAKGINTKEFNDKYVDGREPYPWDQWLPKAGWRIHVDSLRQPRLGVSLQRDSTGLLVVIVDPGSMAATAGIQPGDVITSVDGIRTSNPAWEGWRQKFARREGAPIEIKLVRDGAARTLNPSVKFATLIDRRLEADPAASDKAKRIREGILKGTTTGARQ
jgi:predicted metalloprotease with PDZ domain